MGFSVLMEVLCDFVVLDDFLNGFLVSNRPRCPPL